MRRWCWWPGIRCAGDWREPPSAVCGSPHLRETRQARADGRQGCVSTVVRNHSRSERTVASLLKSHAVTSSGAVCAAATSALRQRRSACFRCTERSTSTRVALYIDSYLWLLPCACVLLICVTGVLALCGVSHAVSWGGSLLLVCGRDCAKCDSIRPRIRTRDCARCVLEVSLV